MATLVLVMVQLDNVTMEAVADCVAGSEFVCVTGWAASENVQYVADRDSAASLGNFCCSVNSPALHQYLLFQCLDSGAGYITVPTAYLGFVVAP